MLCSLYSCTNQSTTAQQEQAKATEDLHLVFITGDEEYRSEESMPMLAKIMKRELKCRVSICYATDSTGLINPNNTRHIEGLEAVKSADLVVVFTRFRELPAEEARYITDYVESGKPIVGFRTATHTFKYLEDSSMFHLNEEWPMKVFGQKWITHHGHFEDGSGFLTDVALIADQQDHAVLRGVAPFQAYSWLYHVQGGEHKLWGDSKPLLLGTSLRSNHQEEGALDKYPLTNPVAWTKTYTGTAGKTARVFFTTLGHPYDFKDPSMRKLAANGIAWALGLESKIPAQGLNVAFVDEYNPNNSGFGDKFKKGLKPVLEL